MLGNGNGQLGNGVNYLLLQLRGRVWCSMLDMQFIWTWGQSDTLCVNLGCVVETPHRIPPDCPPPPPPPPPHTRHGVHAPTSTGSKAHSTQHTAMALVGVGVGVLCALLCLDVGLEPHMTRATRYPPPEDPTSRAAAGYPRWLKSST
jgi:hypothetical protein